MNIRELQKREGGEISYTAKGKLPSNQQPGTILTNLGDPNLTENWETNLPTVFQGGGQEPMIFSIRKVKLTWGLYRGSTLPIVRLLSGWWIVQYLL